jgi:hypothetical protein
LAQLCQNFGISGGGEFEPPPSPRFYATEHSHSFGPIHKTMQILQHEGKGAHLSTIERYLIYTEFSKNNHLNDEYNITPNKTFDALLKPHQT